MSGVRWSDDGNSVLGFRGDYSFLSNFYTDMDPIVVRYKEQGSADGDIEIAYPTSEHMYQAYKSLRLEDRIAVSKIPKPGKTKHTTIKRKNWHDIKVDVMRHILCLKFSQPILKEKLLNTGDMQLIEVNWWYDRFWGTDEFLHGENHLGILLMSVRDQLRDEMT